MTTAEIEQIYTALAESLGRIAEHKRPLLLATLALDLLHRLPDAASALEHIRTAEMLAER